MTIKVITAIALRFFALWLLVQVIFNLPSLLMISSTVEFFQGEPLSQYMGWALLLGVMLIGLLAAYLLWRSAHGALTLSAKASQQSEPGLLDEQGQRFLLQLGGGYFIVNGLALLPSKINFLLSLVSFSAVPGSASYSGMPGWVALAAVLLQLGIGVSLMVHNSWWRYLFAKLRGRA